MRARNLGHIGRLPARRKWSVYLISSGVWLTGMIWLLLHYFLKTIDKYGFAKARPSEHYALIAHAAFGVGAVWMFGVLWPVHVKPGWRAHIRRLSGGTLFGFTAWLIKVFQGISRYFFRGRGRLRERGRREHLPG